MGRPTKADLDRRVGISLRTQGVRVNRPQLRHLIQRCLEVENAELGRGIEVVLCGDRLMRRLNRDYREKDRTTDVLSFPDPEGIPLPEGVAAPPLGEVFVSIPQCRRQALEQNVRAGTELARLLIHGTLHVLGFDHETEAERREMKPREQKLRAWARRHEMGPELLLFGEDET